MNREKIYQELKRGAAGIVDLSARAQFHLSGADRVRFLNGQVSSDVRRLSPRETQRACVLTAKGKLCGDVFLTGGTGGLLRIDAEPELRDSLAARLERYLIADDARIEDVTDHRALIHVLPMTTDRWAAGDVPRDAEFDLVQSRRYGATGVDLIVSSEQFDEAWHRLGEHCMVIDPDLVETLRVEAGIPRWGAELDENTIPVEAGLDQTSIDYHKGCYVGQEVISRLKSIGHVNRHLHGFVSEAPLAAGMQLFAPDAPEKPVGRLTSEAWSFGLEKWSALGYLRRGIDTPVLHARLADASAGDETLRVEVKALPLIPPPDLP